MGRSCHQRHQLTAIPRLLSSSSWNLETPHRRRSQHPHGQSRVASACPADWRTCAKPARAKAKLVERLLFPFARSVPGAVEYGQAIDPARTIDAAQAELA